MKKTFTFQLDLNEDIWQELERLFALCPQEEFPLIHEQIKPQLTVQLEQLEQELEQHLLLSEAVNDFAQSEGMDSISFI